MSKSDMDELKKISNRVEKLYEAFIEEKEENKKHREEVEPLLDLIRGGVVARKFILAVTSVIIGVIGSYIAIKNLF